MGEKTRWRIPLGIAQLPLVCVFIGVAALSTAAGPNSQLTAAKSSRIDNLRSHYINPLEGQSWGAGRFDQGVDWKPRVKEPIRAIGNGVVTYSSERDTYWPDRACIAYRLTDGPMAGRHIYVAEHITNLVKKGKRIQIGERIAVAHPGYPYTEWGWSTAGCRPAVRYRAGCGEGWATPGGLAFARFLRELGVGQQMGSPRLRNPGPGPDVPYAGRCKRN